MLTKVDGVLLAVHDADTAAKTFGELFGAEVIGTGEAPPLGATVTDVGVGRDRIGLAVPTGPGIVKDRLDAWGEGIFGVAFATDDVPALRERIKSKGVSVAPDDAKLFMIDPAHTHGLITWVMPHVEREPVGVISFIYEVTHLVEDWKGVSDLWTDLFGLDGAKFSPISSKQYGYDGMLTLFDPPDKLDRIEVVYPHDATKAMGKFFQKRGEGPYMFFAECDDVPGLVERLRSANARFAGGEGNNSLFLHPSSTHGVLIGVSPTNQAWVWSGRPELANAEA